MLNVVQVVLEIHIFSGNIVDSTIVNSAALKVLFHFFFKNCIVLIALTQSQNI